MRKMRRGISFFLMFVLALSFVSAIDTQITLKVNPNAEVKLNILNPESLQAYQVFYLNSSETGVASATFSGDVSIVAVSFVVWKEGKIVKYVKASDYGNFSTSSSINIDTLQEINTASTVNTTNTTVVENTTVQNVSSSVNRTSDSTNSLPTGKSIDNANETNKSSFVFDVYEKVKGVNYMAILKVVGYVVGAVFIIGVILLIVFKVKSRSGYAREFKVRGAEFASGSKDRGLSEAEKKICHAQEEIKCAQEEINKIRNRKTEVRQAEEKFLQAKNDLEKLRGKF